MPPIPAVPEMPHQPLASGPRVRERGHLILVDWEGVAPTAPAPARTATKATGYASPLSRTWVDRAFDRGFLVLLAVTALGAAASLVQH